MESELRRQRVTAGNGCECEIPNDKSADFLRQSAGQGTWYLEMKMANRGRSDTQVRVHVQEQTSHNEAEDRIAQVLESVQLLFV